MEDGITAKIEQSQVYTDKIEGDAVSPGVLILASHCNTEQVALFGLSLHDTSTGQSWFIALNNCGLDPNVDKGITGLCQVGDLLYAAVQSVYGGKVLVLDTALNYRETIVLQYAEDLHSIAVQDGVLYVVSTRNSSLVAFNLAAREECVFWQHETYIHLNDVKFHQGELYVLSQDSPYSEENSGGTVTRLSDNKKVLTGLDQPHSMLFDSDYLTVLSSRAGDIVRVELKSGKAYKLAHLQGYVRGIWQTHDNLFVATSAERLHSRKEGPAKVYVESYDDYFGNSEFQSNLYQLDQYGNQSRAISLSALNFEVYDLLSVARMPAATRLTENPGAIKAQYYRRSLLARDEGEPEPARLLKSNTRAAFESDTWWESLKAQGYMLLYRDHKDNFVRGCWYFSDAWPLNFWNNVEKHKVRHELKKIKKLGFNSVFIVIPWRGFQPDPCQADVSPAHMQRARSLLAICLSLKLRVYARVSYGHAICNDSEEYGNGRVRALLTDPAVLKNWLAYLSSLNSLAKNSSLASFFLCWEDFWDTFSGMQNFLPLERRDLAERVGYQSWLEENYGLDYYNSDAFSHEVRYGSIHDVEVPLADSGRHRYFMQFRTARLRELFKNAQDYISPLSMEYRVDRDRYRDSQGKMVSYRNDDYADVQIPAMSYWAPFMNTYNQGECLSAHEAIYNLKHMLESNPERAPTFTPIINQFNFIDKTPEYIGKHATIAEDEVSSFLEESTHILLEHTSGFGIWALRSYFQNLIYNASFVNGSDGWETSGRCRFRRVRSEPVVQLFKGASIFQRFTPLARGMDWIKQSTELSLTVDFDARSNRQLDIELSGHDQISVDVQGPHVTVKLNLNASTSDKDELVLSVKNCGEPVDIRRVSLYSYEFGSDIQDAWGDSARYESDLCQLNQRIRAQRRRDFASRLLQS